MNKNIHFIPSYVCLRDFLSIFDPNIENIIVCNRRYSDLVLFLQKAVNNCVILELEEIYIKDYLTGNYNNYASNFIDDFLGQINPEDEVFFYSDKFTINYFLIINNLRVLCKTYFIDSEPTTRMNKLTGIKDAILSALIGFSNLYNKINLKYINIGMRTVLWVHGCSKYSLVQKSWEEIRGIINIKEIFPANLSDKSVLYIHQNMQLENVDYIETQKNLVGLIKILEEESFNVYFKDHPNNSEDTSYLTDIIRTDNIIPSFVPVELLGDIFEKYMTFFSLGISPFLNNSKCYSLYNYIKFTKNDDRIIKFINDNLINIELLKINPKDDVSML